MSVSSSHTPIQEYSYASRFDYFIDNALAKLDFEDLRAAGILDLIDELNDERSKAILVKRGYCFGGGPNKGS